MIFYVSVGLLGLLSLSIPVGIVLFLLGFGIDTFFSSFPLTRGWATWCGPSVFCVVGRDPCPQRCCHPHLCGAGSLGVVAAGRVGARQYRNGDDVFSHVGIIGGHRGDCCHSGHASGRKLGYDPKLFSGAIAAGGTLGIMIPPSINLIVYGFLTQSSIPQLVPCRADPRSGAGGCVHGDHGCDLPDPSEPWRCAADLSVSADAAGID